MSDRISIDIWAKILSKLQVKSLLRLRSVSTSFRDLIDSRYFVKLHLDYSAQTKSNRKILIVNQGVLSIDYDKFDRAIRRACPREWTSSTQYVSSYHGVVLLFDGANEFTLWNPSRRRYIHLTLPPMSIPSSCVYEKFKYSLGFGYSDDDDDYKIVKIVHYDRLSAKIGNPDLLKKFGVYSLRNNSWKRVQDFPFNLSHRHHHATFVGGAMHWVCEGETNVETNETAQFIAAFDLRTEEYRIVPAPQYERSVQLTIGSFEDRLWAHCYYINRSDLQMEIADTWVMEEYGVRESWTKLPSPQPIDFQKPVAYSKCGTYLLLDNSGSFLSYDLLMDEFDEIGMRAEMGMRGVFYKADLCVESLVHLNAGENNDENQQIREKVLTEDYADHSDGTPDQP